MASRKSHYKITLNSRIQFSTKFRTEKIFQAKCQGLLWLNNRLLSNWLSIAHITVAENQATIDSWEMETKKILCREIFFNENQKFLKTPFSNKKYVHAKVDLFFINFFEILHQITVTHRYTTFIHSGLFLHKWRHALKHEGINDSVTLGKGLI